MKLSMAKRRINKTLDELTQSVIDDWYDHFKNGYIKGYTDAREGVAPMYADAIADTPQTDCKLTANENSVEIPTETENFTSKSREKSKLKQTDCGWK